MPAPGLISHSSIGGGSFGNGGGSLGNGGGSGKSFSLSESLLFLEVTFSENWETFTLPIINTGFKIGLFVNYVMPLHWDRVQGLGHIEVLLSVGGGAHWSVLPQKKKQCRMLKIQRKF